MVYPRITHTDQPAIVLGEHGASRTVLIPGDTGRAYWRSQNPDLRRLLVNALRWMLHDPPPVTVTGEGMAEVFAWKTAAGHAVHILNYTNPAMQRGWETRAYAIGPQRVRFTLPSGAAPSQVRLLRANRTVPFTRRGPVIEFTVPAIVDYEVAAII